MLAINNLLAKFNNILDYYLQKIYTVRKFKSHIFVTRKRES